MVYVLCLYAVLVTCSAATGVPVPVRFPSPAATWAHTGTHSQIPDDGAIADVADTYLAGYRDKWRISRRPDSNITYPSNSVR